MKRYLLLLSLLLSLGAFGQTPQGSLPQVAISEIMFNPPEANTDTLEYLEITNYGGSTINLNGWTLQTGVEFTFPNITIAPGQYIVVATDSAAFLSFYGFAAYDYAQALNNSGGDTLRLYDSFNNLIDFVPYRSNSAPWPQGTPSPNGGGPSIEFCDFQTDNSIGSNWSIATTPTGNQQINGLQVYGTPGAGCAATSPPVVATVTATSPTTVTVLFNEAVNTTAENVANYTGLGQINTATRDVPQTTITLTLAQPLANGVQYTLTIANVEDLLNTAMAQPQSFNFIYNNTIADLQITEIMYDNPSSDDYEFIELYNRGSSAAYIGGYKFTSGVTFTFPPDTIAPGGFLYISAFPSTADNFFSFDSYQYTGNLANTGEKLQIVNTVGDVIDSLTYSNVAPWPLGAAGDGASITLCNSTSDNSNPANWAAAVEYIGNIGVAGAYANINLVSCTVGLTEDAKENGIVLAPNPVEGELVIYNTGNKAYTLQVFDAMGRMVISGNAAMGANTFNTDALSAGLYIVRMADTASNSLVTLKFLKK
ncbi:MAG: lamin tail domain-containing protein [Sphingobacteriales bacterium JAD_PAG50586_3]|nr:MAG: lamin tail domain-containing protein [Sphingobacteriales bacterium JAD_PAG50586_3]